ncbi:MAG TPA: CPBP family glutamic-type intramembrane protease [Mucilaginibacter sp.]|jgi:hypothetical protein|nr:CPBP family glutamic-type intramembrane protease [Mucilaginibacter sp.]
MLSELLKISEYPDLALKPRLSFKEKLALVFKTYAFIFIVILFTAPVIILADYIATHVFHYGSIRNQNNTTFQHLIKKIGYLTAIVYICLIGPVLEETIFRLPLSFKRAHIALSVSVAILLFSSAIPFIKHLHQSIGLGWALSARVGFSALVFWLIFIILPKQINFSSAAKKRLIIISICLFGLMHVSNYSPLHWAIIWIYPIYVLPQLCMGWALSYIRFKNGFIWGIALHCLINSVAMGLGFSQNKPDKIHQIEKQALKPKTQSNR